MLFHPKPSSLPPAWFFLFYKLMKEIQLTQGKVALVDDEDFEYLNQWKWYARKCRDKFYAQRHIKVNGNDTTIPMHRQIINPIKGMVIDHINRDTLNNCKDNLRECTNGENMKNRSIYKNNKSGYKGIRFIEKSKKWVVVITNNTKKIHIGYFVHLKNAIKAYNKAAVKYHGEFANLNKID